MSESDNPFDRSSARPPAPASDNPFDRSTSTAESSKGDNPFDRSDTPDAGRSDNPFDRSTASVGTEDGPVASQGAVDGDDAVLDGTTTAVKENPFRQSSPPPAIAPASVVPASNEGFGGLRSVDLTGRERHLRAAISSMGRVATAFARASRRTLPFLVWRKSKLVPGSVAINAAPGAATQPTGPALHAVYDEPGGSGWACVTLNDVSLGLILEGALGGAESKGGFTFGKELTLAQRALASRLIRSLGNDLVTSLTQLTEASLELSGVYASPTDSIDQVQRTDGLSVDCGIDGVPGALITISVQSSLLEGGSHEDEDEDEPEGDPRMHLVVQEVPVDVVAELGRLTLGLRKVLKLEAGQVLRLSTAVDDPVRVDVAGLKKFVGVPVVSRGQLAVEIRGRVGD